MDIIDAATQAESLSGTLAVRISNLEKQVQEREARLLANATKGAPVSSELDAGARRVAVDLLRNQAKRDARQYRRELLASTDKERTERLKQLTDMDALAAQLAPLYERPQQLLSRQGLGSPERSRYQEQLRDAGPAELVSMRDWALHTRDVNLGAAILSRLDRSPTNSRPFDAAEFAMQLVGPEFDATRKAIARVRVAAQRALNANRDFEQGRVDATAKIGMGLAQRSIA
jgi:hypothetical protein